jgi:hypothetical protein
MRFHFFVNQGKGIIAMLIGRHALVTLIFFFSAGLAQADGLLYKLPKDGSWALYDFTPDIKAKNVRYKGTLKISSVGQVTEQNQPCRWIEVQMDISLEMGDNREVKSQVFKVLVPEVFLAKGEAPLEHVLRGWIKRGKGEPRPLSNPNSIEVGLLPLALSGPWKSVKKLEKVEVESKLGKLECEGVQGTLEFPRKEKDSMQCKLESRLNPDSPFGVVTARWINRLPELPKPGTLEWNLKLIDYGDGAKSQIPDVTGAGVKDKAPEAKADDKGKSSENK